MTGEIKFARFFSRGLRGCNLNDKWKGDNQRRNDRIVWGEVGLRDSCEEIRIPEKGVFPLMVSCVANKLKQKAKIEITKTQNDTSQEVNL